MIKAEGLFIGEKLEVVSDGKKFLFNGEEDKTYEKYLKGALRTGYPVGGTFYPPKESRINILNVLENHFFDDPVDAVVEDEEIETIPWEEGVMY